MDKIIEKMTAVQEQDGVGDGSSNRFKPVPDEEAEKRGIEGYEELLEKVGVQVMNQLEEYNLPTVAEVYKKVVQNFEEGGWYT